MKQGLDVLPDDLRKEIIGVSVEDESTHFPTLGVCPRCMRYNRIITRIFGDEIAIDNPQMAYEVALIRYGSNLEKWGKNVLNREFVPEPCTCCTCNHEWTKEILYDRAGEAYEYTCTKCGDSVIKYAD